MRDFEQTGLVKRTKILKEVRHHLRDQLSREGGLWTRVKAALDTVRVGERDDIVLVKQLGSEIVGLAIVTYREIHGLRPKVRISPIIVTGFDSTPDTDVPLWQECIVEVTSRLMELHSAVAASGAEGIDITTTGKATLKAQLDDSINSVFEVIREGDGFEIKLNDTPITPGVWKQESVWPAENGPMPGTLIGIAAKWSNEDDADDDYLIPRRALKLASHDTWERIQPGKERCAYLDVDIDGTIDEVQCHLSSTNDISRLEQALIGSTTSNIMQYGIHYLVGAAERNQASLFTLWSDDARLLAISSAVKCVGIRRADSKNWHIGLEYLILLQPEAGTDGDEIADLVAEAMIDQLQYDLESLAVSALEHTEEVLVDVLVHTMVETEDDPVVGILDAIVNEDLADSTPLPDGAAIGKVMTRMLPKSMARQMGLGRVPGR